jgi:hypothetical protein
MRKFQIPVKPCYVPYLPVLPVFRSNTEKRRRNENETLCKAKAKCSSLHLFWKSITFLFLLFSHLVLLNVIPCSFHLLFSSLQVELCYVTYKNKKIFFSVIFFLGKKVERRTCFIQLFNYLAWNRWLLYILYSHTSSCKALYVKIKGRF